MLSDAAYDALKQASATRRHSRAVLSTALRLYQENYLTMKAANSAMTPQKFEALQLVPTSITSLLDQSEREFRNFAKEATLPERISRGIKDAAWNISLNITASLIFVVLSVGAYLALQSTAQDFFQSIGFDVQPAREIATPEPQTSNQGPDDNAQAAN